MRILTTLTLLVFITACGKQNPKEDTKVQTGYNIYGKVDKVATADIKYLYRVGKLEFSTKNGLATCTASLVGKSLLLTSSHCVFDSKTGEIYSDFKFYLGLTHDNYLAKTTVKYAWWGSKTPLRDRSYQDWAILETVEPLGKKYGYFGLKTVNSNTDNDAYNVALPGYGTLFEQGKTLTVDEGCNVRKVINSLLMYHDCDMAKGDSGSPLVKCDKNDNCFVIGVNSYQRHGPVELDEYDQKYHNAAISSAQFYNLLYELRVKEESKKSAQE